jgi:transposase
MWTSANRARYNRDTLRFPSDPTEAEWALVQPLVPPAKHGGRDREVDVREVVNGNMFLLGTGAPVALDPERSATEQHLARLSGPLERRQHADGDPSRALRTMSRYDAARAEPTSCAIDSQSVRRTEKGGRDVDPNGYDAAKKI